MRDYESTDLAGAAYLARDGVYERPSPNEYADDIEAPTEICRTCGEEIEYEGDRYVHVLSGDEGGTYDFCEASPATGHWPKNSND